jgi:DNA-binding LacI/PurR family transcriptional regulator
LQALLKRPDRPTAICGYAHEPLAAWEVALTRGLRVPGDLSIAMINGERFGMARPVSMVVSPWAEVGTAAAGVLIAALAGGSPQTIAVPPQWDAGATLGQV